MKKVNLENVRLAKSALTDNVYIGIPYFGDNSWSVKEKITSDFLTAVVDRFNGYEEVIHKIENNEDKYYKIKCIEISEEKAKELKEE